MHSLWGGEHYTLSIDESQRIRPQCDIEHFRHKIPEPLPVLQVSVPEITVHQETREIRKLLWIEKPAVLWSIISLIGLFLAVLCRKVMKQMNP
ncbi:MAG: hypothetical protein LIP01_01190 [Tannerellaceae bacterium]|nr:hypothetical protein [Tannerellaceae bacterium]